METLKVSVESILAARQGRVHARILTSVTGTVLSMHTSWGPVTQLYTRHLYALMNSVGSLNCWVILTEEAINELTFWQKLPRLIFEGSIWPPTEGVACHPSGAGRRRLRMGRAHHARRTGVRA